LVFAHLGRMADDQLADFLTFSQWHHRQLVQMLKELKNQMNERSEVDEETGQNRRLIEELAVEAGRTMCHERKLLLQFLMDEDWREKKMREFSS